jgi:hypothetical protein
MAVEVPVVLAGGDAGALPGPAGPDRCQGRIIGINSRRTRPCSRRGRLRVDGTGGLVAVLCGQHARVAIDRPHVIWDWLAPLRP